MILAQAISSNMMSLIKHTTSILRVGSRNLTIVLSRNLSILHLGVREHFADYGVRQPERKRETREGGWGMEGSY